MSESWLELGIIIFIIAGIGAAIFRAGTANPESTGTLSRKLTRVQGDVRTLTSKVDVIEEQVGHIDQRSARNSDIKRLEDQLATHALKFDEVAKHVAALREDVAGMKSQGSHNTSQLDRLYDFIVKKGLSQ